MVELSIRKYRLGQFANGIVVLLCPALLEANNVWSRISGGDLAANLSQALIAEGSNVLEAPAIQRQDPQAGRFLVWNHGGGIEESGIAWWPP
jgi:hypothetical protein